MKIQKVIHSSNDEPFYLDFWDNVSKIWKVKFGIEPILLHFGNSKVSEQYGTVIKMHVPDGVPINTCCQMSRYWYPVLEPDTIFMTSDIDMFPISKWYFIDQIEKYSDENFINLNCSLQDPKRFACCYNVGKGKTFAEILNLPNSWDDFITGVSWEQISDKHTPDGLGVELTNWSADEIWSSAKILKFDQNRIIKLYRDNGMTSSRRIDRSKWIWNDELIKQSYDCHSIRPYSKHKEEIDNLVERIIEN